MADPSLFNFIDTYAGYKQSNQAQIDSNKARRASVECSYEIKGVGQHRVKTAIMFPIVFRSEPHFTYGSATIRNPSSTYFNDPVGHAGVWQWYVNDKGLYVGAFVWVRADLDPKGGQAVTYSNAILAQGSVNADKTDVEHDQLSLDQALQVAKSVAQTRTLLFMTFTGRGSKIIGTPGLTVDCIPHPVEF